MDSALREKLDEAHKHRIAGDYEAAQRLYEDLIAAEPQPPEPAGGFRHPGTVRFAALHLFSLAAHSPLRVK